jgi:4-amino-4-deoxy-L-arabinose transferase-like glycosyltransferase
VLSPLSRRQYYFFSALILALAAFLRLYQFSTLPPGLWADEAMDGNSALEALETGHWSVFYPEDNGREGLYVNSAALSIAAFGNTAVALRLPAAVFGILTVGGINLLAAEMFDSSVAGLFASFFLAVSFWHLAFSRLAFRAIAAPLFLIGSLYFLFLGMRRLAERKTWIPAIMAAGLVYGLGFYTYIAYRITPLLIGLLWLVWFRKRGLLWRPLTAFALPAILSAMPLGVYFLQHPASFNERTAQVSVLNSSALVSDVLENTWKTIGMLFWEGDANWRHNLSGSPELAWPVATFLIVGIGIFTMGLLKRNSGWPTIVPYAVALAGAILGAVPEVLSNEGIPHSMRALLMVPGIFLLAGAGAAWCWRSLPANVPAVARLALLAILGLALFSTTYDDYFRRWASEPVLPGWFLTFELDIAAAINAQPPDTSTLVAVNSAIVPVRGVSLIAQPIMYLTGTFTSRDQDRRHVQYVTPESLHLPPMPGLGFCRQVQNMHPEAKVYCVQ